MLSTAHYNHEQNHSTATSSYHQDVNFQPANVFLQQLLSRANIVATEQDQTTRSVAISKDPLVNLLVNDGGFATAVHAQQVHTAAALAVSLLRAHSDLPPAGGRSAMPTGTKDSGDSSARGRDFKIGDRVVVASTGKRSAQQLTGVDGDVIGLDGNGWVIVRTSDGSETLRIQQRYLSKQSKEHDYEVALNGHSGPTLPAEGELPLGQSLANVAVTVQDRKDNLEEARNQLLSLEDTVPWHAVKSSWRNRRPGWRRALKAADTVADVAVRLDEFRSHLMNDGATLPMGAAAGPWEQSLTACLQGNGSIAALLTLCNELQQSVRLWLDLKLVHTPVSPTVMSQAIRAVQALQEGSQKGSGELHQVPLEAIVNHSSEGIQAVKNFLESGKTKLSSPRGMGSPRAMTSPKLTPKLMSNTFPILLLSPFNAIKGEFGIDDQFDSGAETDWEAGSQVTDMCDSCCSD
ncbi:g6533 [Coccomyxa elongata]